MMGVQPIRLTNFCVKGLFGEFNHSIPFNADERITALIGPNGLGKTACLKLINALFRRQWSVFAATEFEEVEFKFSDGSRVIANHRTTSDADTEVSDAIGVVFTTFDTDGVSDPWAPRPNEEAPSRLRLDGFVPFLTRTGSKIWTHDLTRQSYTFQEVIENYGEHIPESLIKSFNMQPNQALAKIIGQIDCHLIETQRLLVFQPEEGRRTGGGSSLAISRKAQTLKSIIARELAVYASTSQSLDRSFPKRVVQQGPMILSEDLSERLEQLDALRRGLTEAGILDQEADDSLPHVTEFSPAIAAVLSVYVGDTRKKLDVLAKLRERILLFIELIDNRFYPKSVVVNKSVGFSVIRNDVVEVPLEKLSSGEQHQLVLFFELLFELKENALILIDEPELSLHVAWQKKFIPDLLRIIDLNRFDVLLATHSPQLIGAWENVVVELGDVDPQ